MSPFDSPSTPSEPSSEANGGLPTPSAARRAASDTPLKMMANNERGAHDPENAPAPSEVTTQSLAVFEGPSRGGGENSEDLALREFYSQLVTLLTQENNAQETGKKSRNGVLVALRRRWPAALLITLLTAAGLYAFLRPRNVTYTASTTLLLPPREVSKKQDPLALPEDSYDTRAQLAIFGSEAIVERAMSKVPPDVRQRGWGSPDVEMASVQVNSVGGSDSLIGVSVSSLDPRASYTLVNEMVAAYTSYTRSRYTQNRDENVKATRERLKKTRAQLDIARNDLRKYKEKTGVSNAQSAQSSSAANIDSIENALADARRQAVVSGDDPSLNALRQSALIARSKYDDILRVYFADSPEARAAERDWRSAQSQVETRAAQIASTNRARVTQLERSLAQAKSAAAALPAAEQTLNTLNQRVQLLESANQSATDLYNQLNLASDTVVPTARTLESAGVGSDRTIKKARSMAVSLLAALGLGFLGALLLDRLDKTVRTVSDPEALFSAPVLGAMPTVRSPRGFVMGASQANGPSVNTATIEACYATQSNLMEAARAANARTILLTSSVPNEGKSQCAANLAAAMAYGGRQVVLVDVDFWNPTQHEIFDIKPDSNEPDAVPLIDGAPGYAQILHDEIALSQAIRTTNVANLHLVTAGAKVQPQSHQARELVESLGSVHHQKIIETLKRYFDVVIVDGPPTSSLADAQLLCNLTDAVLLVAADSTRRDQVQRARSMLRLSGANLLGVVINSVRLSEINRWNLDFTPEEPFRDYGEKTL